MKLPSSFDFKPLQIVKIAAIALLAILVLSFAYRLVGSSFRPMFQNSAISSIMAPGMPSYDMALRDSYGGTAELSPRNIAIQPAPTAPGDDLEAFEITEYSAHIETGDAKETCGSLEALKGRDEVIFEYSNTYEHGCSFTFKVKRDYVEDVLAVLREYDPKDLSENTRTIKQIVNDYTSELEILESKKKTIEDTLAEATRAYDEITQLATGANDVETLAKIIDSKLRIIERLTQERINVNEQLDRLNRAKAQELDRLDYTYFHVSVTENKYIDGESLKDSWKTAVKQFFRDINRIAQELSIGLVALMFLIVQYSLYALILVIVAKYGWRLIKHIWTK